MTNEQIDNWIAALRSGNYTQTTGSLRRVGHVEHPDGYCCLGVLAEQLGLPLTPVTNKFGTVFHIGEYTVKNSQFLSADVVSKEQQFVLSSMNDCGYSFIRIADYLEDNKHAYCGTK